MSVSKNEHEARRWLQTGAEDLAAAVVLLDAGHYAQACFLAQQCGEKAVKALWYLVDADPWGHSIQRLVSEFPTDSRFGDVGGWAEKAAYLDKYYIPTRYPNGLPDLTPGQSYFRSDAESAIERASWILDECRRLAQEARI